MSWRILFAESLAALKSHRRRTIVTTVSLGWGLACFLILMSYGNGYERAMLGAFRAIGQDLILVGGGQTSLEAGGLRAGRRIRLRTSDAAAIREAAPLVGPMSPEVFAGDRTVVHGNRQKDYSVRGVWPEYRSIRNMHVLAGRWFSAEDNLRRERVAVLGATMAKELFAGIPPAGEAISIGGIRFMVIGVLETKGQLANYSQYDNLCVFIPYDTMSLFRQTLYTDLIVLSPISPLVREEAIRQVRATLATLHRFSPNDERAIDIIEFNKFLEGFVMVITATKFLLGFVGALTLGIGGVGLANLMLASVVDRTREIGMLKAIGGKRRTILAQFLLEGLAIVGIGAVLGVSLGTVMTFVIGSMPLLGPLLFMLGGEGNMGEIEFTVSFSAIAVSTGILLLVGLVAGMVPAIRAARLDPIEALRYE